MYTWLGAHSGRPVLYENGQVAGQGTRGKPSDSDDQGTLMGSRRGVDASPRGGKERTGAHHMAMSTRPSLRLETRPGTTDCPTCSVPLVSISLFFPRRRPEPETGTARAGNWLPVLHCLWRWTRRNANWAPGQPNWGILPLADSRSAWAPLFCVEETRRWGTGQDTTMCSRAIRRGAPGRGARTRATRCMQGTEDGQVLVVVAVWWWMVVLRQQNGKAHWCLPAWVPLGKCRGNGMLPSQRSMLLYRRTSDSPLSPASPTFGPRLNYCVLLGIASQRVTLQGNSAGRLWSCHVTCAPRWARARAAFGNRW